MTVFGDVGLVSVALGICLAQPCDYTQKCEPPPTDCVVCEDWRLPDSCHPCESGAPLQHFDRMRWGIPDNG